MNLVELSVEDSIVETLPTDSGFVCKAPTGIRVHHKPTNLVITYDKCNSGYSNRAKAFLILRDLLTEFTEGDIVYTDKGEGLLINTFCGTGTGTVETVSGLRTVALDSIGHTEIGYIYRKQEVLRGVIKDHKDCIARLEREIEEIGYVK